MKPLCRMQQARKITVFSFHSPLFPSEEATECSSYDVNLNQVGCCVQSDFSVSYEQTNRGEYKWQRRENQTTVFATFPPSGRIASLQNPHRYASRTWCQAARVKLGYEKKNILQILEIWLFRNDPHVAVKTQRHLMKNSRFSSRYKFTNTPTD